MSGYLADTSVFVAAEQRRALGRPPEGEARISVATLTELGVGARMAENPRLRQLRAATLDAALRFVALPYDELVAERLADLLAEARTRKRKAGAMDAIIAATALVHDLDVWTPGRRLRSARRAGSRASGSTRLNNRHDGEHAANLSTALDPALSRQRTTAA